MDEIIMGVVNDKRMDRLSGVDADYQKLFHDVSEEFRSSGGGFRPEKPVYPLREVCEDGGFGLSTAWKYIKAGRIQTIKMGNRRCITAAERRRILTQGF